MDGTANMFDYIDWRGDLTLAQDFFGKVDGMIFSRFSYVPFDLAFCGEKGFMTVKRAAELLLAKPQLKERVIYEEDITLIEKMAKSRRYQELEIGNFVDYYDEQEEGQCSALVVKLSDGIHGIVFRGTDDTLLGWKEDFNMGFLSPIPSQEKALSYVEDYGQKFDGKLILMGHSKGGNVASYAAAFCNEKLQERILTVYNYDGPGFTDEVLAAPGFSKICGRINTYVPQASFIGLILGHKEEHHVIHSSESKGGLWQHNLYTWDIMGAEFIYEEKIVEVSQNLNMALHDWISKINCTQREKFVESTYAVFRQMNVKTLSELKGNWREYSKILFQHMKNLDEDSKKILSEGFGLLLETLWHTLRNG